MVIICRSLLTGHLNFSDLPIEAAGIQRWQEGLPIQVALPDLTDGEREFILTGITEEEWAELFGNVYQTQNNMQTRTRVFKICPDQRAIVTDLLSHAMTGESIAMANFATLSDTTPNLEHRKQAVEYAWCAKSRAEGFYNLALQFGLTPWENPEGQYWKGLRTCFLRHARKEDYVACLIIQMVMTTPFLISLYDDIGVELDNKMGEYFCLLAEEGREMLNQSLETLCQERKKNPDAFGAKCEQLHWDAMTILARWTAKVDLGGHCGVCAGNCMKDSLHEMNLSIASIRENGFKLYQKTLERLGLPEERTKTWMTRLPA